jgi:hemerythrin-like domain-containing protein
MKITEALVAEHKTLLSVFDQIETVLPGLETVVEIRTLASIVEGLLKEHAEAEANLAYLALDHLLAEKGQLEHMHQDHQEIDACLKRVHTASTCAAAGRLIKSAIARSREHFRGEETSVFPMLERVLREETLVDLGTCWLERRPQLSEARVTADCWPNRPAPPPEQTRV